MCDLVAPTVSDAMSPAGTEMTLLWSSLDTPGYLGLRDEDIMICFLLQHQRKVSHIATLSTRVNLRASQVAANS